MHPDDRQKLKDMVATYDVMLRRYGELQTVNEELGRKVIELEETLIVVKRSTETLTTEMRALQNRVDGISRGQNG